MTNASKFSPTGLLRPIPTHPQQAVFWFVIGASFALAVVDLFLTFRGL